MIIKKDKIVLFYDELCKLLTDWECSEISDFELYDFLVDLQNKIAETIN